jgi:hypothetical protein
LALKKVQWRGSNGHWAVITATELSVNTARAQSPQSVLNLIIH